MDAANLDYVLGTARQRGVTFVRLWWTDVRGAIKGVAFPVSELEAIARDGVGVDGAAQRGAGAPRSGEIDLVARPDISGFQVLPWRERVGVARMFADLMDPAGEPFAGDPRHVLRRAEERAAGLGLALHVGAELECYLLQSAELPPRPVEGGGAFDLTPTDIACDFRKQTIEFLEHLGVPVRASHHEAGPAQQEFVLGHAGALETADALLTTRMAIKQAALNLGMHATFMPKPLPGAPGSALHLHCSLFDEAGENRFDGGDAAPLSPLGASFTAGVLARAAEITAVACQWQNSHRRLAAGAGAPADAGWSRSAPAPFVRVPGRRPGNPAGARIELRVADAGASPHLVLALVLAAGLDGIETGAPLPAEQPPGVAGEPLPRSLAEGADLLDGSEFVRGVLGEALTDWLVAGQRAEATAHALQVTELELRDGLANL